MYIINEKGERIEDINYKSEWLYEKCALVADDLPLEDVWILELSSVDFRKREEIETEPVKEILFTHEPTKDDVLRAIVLYGTSSRDIAIVRHGYRIK